MGNANVVSGGGGENNNNKLIDGLSEDELNFIAKHTSIDRVVLNSHHSAFLTRHPNGKINRKEFRNMLQQCYPTVDVNSLEKHIFRMYDLNNDGHIDFREFMLTLYIMSSGSAEENLKLIFNVFDINRDGLISVSEMKRIVKGIINVYKCHFKSLAEGDIVDTLFLEMDSNKDGKISVEEFVSACMTQQKISSMITLRIVDVFIGIGEDDNDESV